MRLTLGLAVMLVATIASAEDAEGPAPPTAATPSSPQAFRKKPPDPMLGRIEGDVSVGAALGATFAPRSPRLALDLRARYLSTAGAFATYEDAGSFSFAANPSRVFSFGIEVRPLFLPRAFGGYDFGGNRWDLLVDSFAFEVGVAWVEPTGGTFTKAPGAKLGLGFEVPLMKRATGLFLATRGGALWSGEALTGTPVRDASDRSLYLFVGLAWHQTFVSGFVDSGDAAPE